MTNKKYHSIIFAIIIASVLVACNFKSNKNQSSHEINYLNSLEILFKGVPTWLETVYDEQSGGFYHNALMKGERDLGPDIQSTTFALTILSSGNILEPDKWSQEFKNKMENYINSRFDTVTQLYFDPLYKEKVLQSERALARSQNMAKSIYTKLEVSPPGNGFKMGNVPEYLLTFEAFEAWFYRQHWERVWTAFDVLVSNTSFIKQLPDKRADSIVQFIQKYVEKTQNEDGLWGKGQAQEVRLSGAAKYGSFCKSMQIPMPNADKMYNTILQWFRENRELDFSEHSPCPICVPRNALHLLNCIKGYLSFEIPENDKKVLIKSTYEMLKFYKNADGGFMKSHKESKIAPLDLNLGEYDTLVSDMNGVQLAITARVSLYEILEIKVPVLKSSIGF